MNKTSSCWCVWTVIISFLIFFDKWDLCPIEFRVESAASIFPHMRWWEPISKMTPDLCFPIDQARSAPSCIWPVRLWIEPSHSTAMITTASACSSVIGGGSPECFWLEKRKLQKQCIMVGIGGDASRELSCVRFVPTLGIENMKPRVHWEAIDVGITQCSGDVLLIFAEITGRFRAEISDSLSSLCGIILGWVTLEDRVGRAAFWGLVLWDIFPYSLSFSKPCWGEFRTRFQFSKDSR